MNYRQFKDDVSSTDQIKMLLRAARTFGVPVITHKLSETEGHYSVTYQSKGEPTTLVLKLAGEDNQLMIDCLEAAKRSNSDEQKCVAEGS